MFRIIIDFAQIYSVLVVIIEIRPKDLNLGQSNFCYSGHSTLTPQIIEHSCKKIPPAWKLRKSNSCSHKDEKKKLKKNKPFGFSSPKCSAQFNK